MASLLVGCGGWQYFDVGGGDALPLYARAYDFVEVNSTFYSIPDERVVASWRRKVPESFVFVVKAHRRLTHALRFSPVQESYDVFSSTKKICKILLSPLLVMETPASFDVGGHLGELADFFSSVGSDAPRMAWEMRCYAGRQAPREVVDFMRDRNIVHCVDASVSRPAFESDVVYSRLFGKGKGNIYQFSDGELSDINEQMEQSGAGRKYVTFHGVRMYKDAARMILYRKTGAFPRVTRSVGQASLAEVLREDARFPATRKELIDGQGWKLFDLSENERRRVSDVLAGIPEKSFSSVEEILEQVRLP